MNSDNSNKTTTMVIYGLQAASFLIGITFIVAVVINYMKKNDVRGTWLESHFKWQINTFWYGLLWSVIGLLTTVFLIGFVILFANAVWIIYRIVKGWLCLNDGKEI